MLFAATITVQIMLSAPSPPSLSQARCRSGSVLLSLASVGRQILNTKKICVSFYNWWPCLYYMEGPRFDSRSTAGVWRGAGDGGSLLLHHRQENIKNNKSCRFQIFIQFPCICLLVTNVHKREQFVTEKSNSFKNCFFFFLFPAMRNEKINRLNFETFNKNNLNKFLCLDPECFLYICLQEWDNFNSMITSIF